MNESQSENALSNDRGTFAVAHWDVPDCGNSEFFINLKHNKHLDTACGGYCVFAKIASDDAKSFSVVVGHRRRKALTRISLYPQSKFNRSTAAAYEAHYFRLISLHYSSTYCKHCTNCARTFRKLPLAAYDFVMFHGPNADIAGRSLVDNAEAYDVGTFISTASFYVLACIKFIAQSSYFSRLHQTTFSQGGIYPSSSQGIGPSPQRF